MSGPANRGRGRFSNIKMAQRGRPGSKYPFGQKRNWRGGKQRPFRGRPFNKRGNFNQGHMPFNANPSLPPQMPPGEFEFGFPHPEGMYEEREPLPQPGNIAMSIFQQLTAAQHGGPGGPPLPGPPHFRSPSPPGPSRHGELMNELKHLASDIRREEASRERSQPSHERFGLRPEHQMMERERFRKPDEHRPDFRPENRPVPRDAEFPEGVPRPRLMNENQPRPEFRAPNQMAVSPRKRQLEHPGQVPGPGGKVARKEESGTESDTLEDMNLLLDKIRQDIKSIDSNSAVVKPSGPADRRDRREAVPPPKSESAGKKLLGPATSSSGNSVARLKEFRGKSDLKTPNNDQARRDNKNVPNQFKSVPFSDGQPISSAQGRFSNLSREAQRKSKSHDEPNVKSRSQVSMKDDNIKRKAKEFGQLTKLEDDVKNIKEELLNMHTPPKTDSGNVAGMQYLHPSNFPSTSILPTHLQMMTQDYLESAKRERMELERRQNELIELGYRRAQEQINLSRMPMVSQDEPLRFSHPSDQPKTPFDFQNIAPSSIGPRGDNHNVSQARDSPKLHIEDSLSDVGDLTAVARLIRANWSLLNDNERKILQESFKLTPPDDPKTPRSTATSQRSPATSQSNRSDAPEPNRSDRRDSIRSDARDTARSDARQPNRGDAREANRGDSRKNDTSRNRAEPQKYDSRKSEPKSEIGRYDSRKVELRDMRKNEPNKSEPRKSDPRKNEPRIYDSRKTDSKKEPPKKEPAKKEPPKKEPPKSQKEPIKEDPQKSAAEKIQCMRCKQKGHIMQYCASRISVTAQPNRDRVRNVLCLRCNKKGHMMRYCPIALPVAFGCGLCESTVHVSDNCTKNDSQTEGKPSEEEADYVCQLCDAIGHSAKKCPTISKPAPKSKSPEGNDQGGNLLRSIGSNILSKMNDESRQYLTAALGKIIANSQTSVDNSPKKATKETEKQKRDREDEEDRRLAAKRNQPSRPPGPVKPASTRCHRCGEAKVGPRHDCEARPTAAYKCVKCDQHGHFIENCPAGKSDALSRNVCLRCEKTGHLTKDCPMGARPAPYPSGGPRGKCGRCDKGGHMTKDCPMGARKSSDERQGPHSIYTQSNMSGRNKCMRCDKVGHMTIDCPMARTAGGASRGSVNTQSQRSRTSCMRCNKSGHMTKDCPTAGNQRGGNNSVQRKVVDHCTMCGQDGHLMFKCHLRNGAGEGGFNAMKQSPIPVLRPKGRDQRMHVNPRFIQSGGPRWQQQQHHGAPPAQRGMAPAQHAGPTYPPQRASYTLGGPACMICGSDSHLTNRHPF